VVVYVILNSYVGITTDRAVYRLDEAAYRLDRAAYHGSYGQAKQYPWGSDNLYSRDSSKERRRIESNQSFKSISSFSVCLFRFQH
jgi:hypothetical protein